MPSDKMTKEATTDRRSRRNLYLDVELIRHRAPLASLPATRAQFGLGALLHHSITPSLHHSITPSLHHSITPSLRAAGFEDEDDDEDSLPDEACGL